MRITQAEIEQAQEEARVARLDGEQSRNRYEWMEQESSRRVQQVIFSHSLIFCKDAVETSFGYDLSMDHFYFFSFVLFYCTLSLSLSVSVYVSLSLCLLSLSANVCA